MVITIPEARRQVKQRLVKKGIESADFESRVLLETVLGTREIMRLGSLELAKDQWEQLQALTDRRCSGEPLQYICGTWEFYGLEFRVGEGVLIPRQDTETIIEAALALRRGKTSTRMLDLCSGSGCIPAVLAKYLYALSGICIEISPQAMYYLKENMARLAPDNDFQLLQMNARVPDVRLIIDNLGAFDIITCNPPYLSKKDMLELQEEINYEPRIALEGGFDGLDFYRRLIPLWKPVLKRGGAMILEVGYGQAAEVLRMAVKEGYKTTYTVQDLCGIERVVVAKV